MTDEYVASSTTSYLKIKNKVLNECENVQKRIILAVHLNNEPLMGDTKLQKIMFLLADAVEEVKEDCGYDADMYGPYSEIVAYELNDLAEMGILDHTRGKIETTAMGKDIANELIKRERQEIVDLLSRYKAFLNDLTVNEALAYIYSAYPEMANESIKIDELKPNMENYIISLVKKQKISSQRTAELLNISHRHAIKKITDRGIEVFE